MIGKWMEGLTDEELGRILTTPFRQYGRRGDNPAGCIIEVVYDLPTIGYMLDAVGSDRLTIQQGLDALKVATQYDNLLSGRRPDWVFAAIRNRALRILASRSSVGEREREEVSQ